MNIFICGSADQIAMKGFFERFLEVNLN